MKLMDQTCGSVRSSTTGTGATGNGRVGSCRDNIPPLLWREETTVRESLRLPASRRLEGQAEGEVQRK